MTQEKEENILKEFPEFFSYLNTGQKIHTDEDPIKVVNELRHQEQIIVPIQFGFEIKDGWYWLLYNTLKNIHDYCTWNKKEYPHITQIKEKFGELRIYFEGGDMLIEGMVWMVEHLSSKICESCGTNVDVGTTEGWIHTVCKSCYEKSSRMSDLKWTPVS